MKTPKTPLLRLLLKQLEQASPQHELSRRKFLSQTGKSAAAIGLASVLPIVGCSDSSGGLERFRVKNSDKKIAIIGAGMAGLRCAYELRKAGISYQIFEASRRIGGRILTHYNDAMGVGIFPEFGGDFIDSNHADMIELVKEFGLELIDLFADQQSNNLAKDIFFFEGRNIKEEEILEEFKKIAPRLKEDIEGLGEQYDSPMAKELDFLPLADYIDALPCKLWLKQLLHAAYVAEYGLDCKEQSTLNMLSMIHFNTDKGFQVFGESDERYRIKGGNAKLIEALTKAVGAEYLTKNAKLIAVKEAAGKYTLSFDGAPTYEADYVVMTIPFTLLREVDLQMVNMSEQKRKCIDELGYGKNTKLVLAYNGRPWREGISKAMGYLFHPEIVNGWDGSETRTEGNTHGAYVAFFGGAYSVQLQQASTTNPLAPPWHVWRTQLPEKTVTQFVQKLDAPFPGSAEKFLDKHVFVNWLDYPYMKGSYSCYKPGQWSTISGLEGEPVGNMYFAGEHCSSDFQGFMNGAAATGKEAAKMLMAALSKA